MNMYYDTFFKRNIIAISPGEFYSTQKDEIISTVLGSCITIALYDGKNHFGGMNHFMLAKKTTFSSNRTSELTGLFGEQAISLLINDMIKKGADRSVLVAKIFGGSSVFNFPESDEQVCNINIKFAFDYLEQEHIPVMVSDTGGIEPRKIFFEAKTSKIWLKRIHMNMPNVQDIIKQEQKCMGIR